MEQKKYFHNQSEKPAYIDKTSDYYRVCPNCRRDFMARHMSQRYCSDKCGDDFNNAKKRMVRSAAGGGIMPSRTEVPVLSPDSVLPYAVQRNIAILDTLSIDPAKGSRFSLEYLDAKGLDFTAYTERKRVYASHEERDCYFLQMGAYRLYRMNTSNILIIKHHKTA